MVTGQAASQELPCEGTAEDTRENNRGDSERIHDQRMENPAPCIGGVPLGRGGRL